MSIKVLLDLTSQQTDDCVLWPYGKNAYGYGRLGTPFGGTRGAHRVACMLAHGDPPVGHDAAHSCRSRACVNPRHLRWATRKENMRDKVRDGTNPTGERHGGAKLDEQDVIDIRSRVRAGEVQSALAAEFGVSRATVCLLVSGKNWAHVPQ